MYLVARKIENPLKLTPLDEVHETLEGAEKEAERLSNLNIGWQYVVFQPVTGKLVLPGSVETISY